MTFLFGQNIKSEAASRDKLTAIYLAQEQMEIIRQQRDNDRLSADWMYSIPLDGDVIVSLKAANNDVRDGYEIISNDDSNAIEALYRNLYCKTVASVCDNGLFAQKSDDFPGNYKLVGFTRWAKITFQVPGNKALSDYFDVVSYVSDRRGVETSISTRFYKWQWR